MYGGSCGTEAYDGCGKCSVGVGGSRISKSCDRLCHEQSEHSGYVSLSGSDAFYYFVEAHGLQLGPSAD